MGIVFSLNAGLDLAKGKYIARMDADDLMLGDRLARQASFLSHHKDYGMVGSWYHTIDASGSVLHSRQVPDSHEELRMLLLFRNQFAHSSVMMRTEIARKLRYNPKYEYCEDHDLWFRISEETKVANLTDFHLAYRWHTENSCHVHQNELKANVLSLLSRELDKIQVQHSTFELKLHAILCFGLTSSFCRTPENRALLTEWTDKIFRSPVLAQRYSPEWISDFRSRFSSLF